MGHRRGVLTVVEVEQAVAIGDRRQRFVLQRRPVEIAPGRGPIAPAIGLGGAGHQQPQIVGIEPFGGVEVGAGFVGPAQRRSRLAALRQQHGQRAAQFDRAHAAVHLRLDGGHGRAQQRLGRGVLPLGGMEYSQQKAT